MCRISDRRPQPVQDYCDAKAKRWHQKTIVETKYLLTSFHDWIEDNNLRLESCLSKNMFAAYPSLPGLASLGWA